MPAYAFRQSPPEQWSMRDERSGQGANLPGPAAVWNHLVPNRIWSEVSVLNAVPPEA